MQSFSPVVLVVERITELNVIILILVLQGLCLRFLSLYGVLAFPQGYGYPYGEPVEASAAFVCIDVACGKLGQIERTFELLLLAAGLYLLLGKFYRGVVLPYSGMPFVEVERKLI